MFFFDFATKSGSVLIVSTRGILWILWFSGGYFGLALKFCTPLHLFNLKVQGSSIIFTGLAASCGTFLKKRKINTIQKLVICMVKPVFQFSWKKNLNSLLAASLNLSLQIPSINTILELSHMNGKTSISFLISL